MTLLVGTEGMAAGLLAAGGVGDVPELAEGEDLFVEIIPYSLRVGYSLAITRPGLGDVIAETLKGKDHQFFVSDAARIVEPKREELCEACTSVCGCLSRPCLGTFHCAGLGDFFKREYALSRIVSTRRAVFTLGIFGAKTPKEAGLSRKLPLR